MGKGLGREEALDLVREIRAGHVPAWHRFVDEYAGLIHAVARRYLAFADFDERRDVFVHILDRLRNGALYSYDGRSRLSTWLFIFSRSRCLDHLRSSRGRPSLPKWLREMSDRDRSVFRLYYVQGLGCAATRAFLAQHGDPIVVDELAESLERLDGRIDEGTRKRMAYDLAAQSIGVASGRLLEFLQRLRIEYEAESEHSDPERAVVQRDLERATEQVRALVHRLPELERNVILQRYYQGRTAREVARELSLDGQREVYTVESRAIRRLRGMLGT